VYENIDKQGDARMKKDRQPGLDARWGRRNRKLSRYKRSILMICAVLVCLTGALAVSSARLQAKNEQYKAQEAELQEQIREQKERSKEIDKFEEYVKTDDYIKDMAEDRLNLVDPNEIVFKPSE
jgi:cell division protein FtsB